MAQPNERRRRRGGPLLRVYETVVVDPEGDFATVISVLPLASVEPEVARRIRRAKGSEPDHWHMIWNELQFTPMRSVHPKRVGAAIKQLFEPAVYYEQRVPVGEMYDVTAQESAQQRALANYTRKVAQAEIVPIEQSLLAPESLADLIGKSMSGGGAVTAYLGLITGQPVLVIGGLFGIVIVKALEAYGTGAAKVMEQAGEHHFRRLLRIPDEKKDLPMGSAPTNENRNGS